MGPTPKAGTPLCAFHFLPPVYELPLDFWLIDSLKLRLDLYHGSMRWILNIRPRLFTFLRDSGYNLELQAIERLAKHANGPL